MDEPSPTSRRRSPSFTRSFSDPTASPLSLRRPLGRIGSRPRLDGAAAARANGPSPLGRREWVPVPFPDVSTEFTPEPEDLTPPRGRLEMAVGEAQRALVFPAKSPREVGDQVNRRSPDRQSTNLHRAIFAPKRRPPHAVPSLAALQSKSMVNLRAPPVDDEPSADEMPAPSPPLVRPVSADHASRRHTYRHHRISRGTLPPSTLVDSSAEAEDIRKLWTAKFSVLPQIHAQNTPLPAALCDGGPANPRGRENAGLAPREEPREFLRRRSLPGKATPRARRALVPADNLADDPVCVVGSPEPTMNRARAGKGAMAASPTPKRPQCPPAGRARGPQYYHPICRKLRPWLKKRASMLQSHVHPPARGGAGPTVGAPCSLCYVVRTGGGFLTLGFGQFCASCTTKIDIDLGAFGMEADFSNSMLQKEMDSIEDDKRKLKAVNKWLVRKTEQFSTAPPPKTVAQAEEAKEAFKEYYEGPREVKRRQSNELIEVLGEDSPEVEELEDNWEDLEAAEDGYLDNLDLRLAMEQEAENVADEIIDTIAAEMLASIAEEVVAEELEALERSRATDQQGGGVAHGDLRGGAASGNAVGFDGSNGLNGSGNGGAGNDSSGVDGDDLDARRRSPFDPSALLCLNKGEEGDLDSGEGDAQRRLRKMPAVIPRMDMDDDAASKKARPSLAALDLELDDFDLMGASALDVLAQFCILPDPMRVAFRKVFDALDSEGTGHIDEQQCVRGLKTINRDLVSDREIEYVKTVLGLFKEATDEDSANSEDGEDGDSLTVDFETFALTAALSRHVVSLDPYVRRCVNSTDYEALVKKKRAAIALFKLDANSHCELSLDHLAIILDSGRVVEDEKQEVIRRLSSDSDRDFITFLEYLAYLPLFLDIHTDILGNTFRQARRSLVSTDIDIDKLDETLAEAKSGGVAVSQDEVPESVSGLYNAM
eukprot:m.36040 g.36040  ORF g.36040 m.36040 type:complete len:940 (-) comp7522_c0_seq1:2685-5504(-)